MTAAYVWTAIAAVAVVFGAWNLFQASVDKEIARALNGSRRQRLLVARSVFYSELCRMVVQAIFLLVGVFAIWAPEDAPEWLGWLVTWGFVFAAGLVAANSVRQALLRRKLRLMRAAQKEGEDSG